MSTLQFCRTSQGLDVFIANRRVGAVVDCPVLSCAFFRTLAGDHRPFTSVSAAVLALTTAVERATADGALDQLKEL